jgi:hypothetical protein
MARSHRRQSRWGRSGDDFKIFHRRQLVEVYMGDSWVPGWVGKVGKDRIEVDLKRGGTTWVYDARNVLVI